MTETIRTIIDVVGLTAFAISGALLAVHRRFDIVGMAVLATVTAVGGGIVRDVLTGSLPPAALTSSWWLAVPLAVAAVTFRFHARIDRLRHTVAVFDAVGLGAFTATATGRAVDAGLPPLTAVLLGTVTGIGGGVLRDLLAGITPAVLSPGARLYAIPAIAGSTLLVAAHHIGIQGGAIQLAAAAAAICGFRLLALWRGWHAPLAQT